MSRSKTWSILASRVTFPGALDLSLPISSESNPTILKRTSGIRSATAKSLSKPFTCSFDPRKKTETTERSRLSSAGSTKKRVSTPSWIVSALIEG